jgi:hypothetical protein
LLLRIFVIIRRNPAREEFFSGGNDRGKGGAAQERSSGGKRICSPGEAAPVGGRRILVEKTGRRRAGLIESTGGRRPPARVIKTAEGLDH